MAPDFERLAQMPWPIATLASSGTSLLSSALACSCSAWADRVREKTAANSAHAFEELMSTVRTAAMRGRGGSAPNKRGSSPLSTWRQNFRSGKPRRWGRCHSACKFWTPRGRHLRLLNRGEEQAKGWIDRIWRRRRIGPILPGLRLHLQQPGFSSRWRGGAAKQATPIAPQVRA
jgi:hypothetical protein